MQIWRRLRPFLFRISPRLADATPIVMNEDSSHPLMGDWTADVQKPVLDWMQNMSIKEILQYIDFSMEVLDFFAQCGPVKVTDWKVTKIRDVTYAGQSALEQTRVIWFLDAHDAIQFKLMFCGKQ